MALKFILPLSRHLLIPLVREMGTCQSSGPKAGHRMRSLLDLCWANEALSLLELQFPFRGIHGNFHMVSAQSKAHTTFSCFCTMRSFLKPWVQGHLCSAFKSPWWHPGFLLCHQFSSISTLVFLSLPGHMSLVDPPCCISHQSLGCSLESNCSRNLIWAIYFLGKKFHTSLKASSEKEVSELRHWLQWEFCLRMHSRTELLTADKGLSSLKYGFHFDGF